MWDIQNAVSEQAVCVVCLSGQITCRIIAYSVTSHIATIYSLSPSLTLGTNEGIPRGSGKHRSRTTGSRYTALISCQPDKNEWFFCPTHDESSEPYAVWESCVNNRRIVRFMCRVRAVKFNIWITSTLREFRLHLHFIPITREYIMPLDTTLPGYLCVRVKGLLK